MTVQLVSVSGRQRVERASDVLYNESHSQAVENGIEYGEWCDEIPKQPNRRTFAGVGLIHLCISSDWNGAMRIFSFNLQSQREILEMREDSSAGLEKDIQCIFSRDVVYIYFQCDDRGKNLIWASSNEILPIALYTVRKRSLTFRSLLACIVLFEILQFPQHLVWFVDL